MGCTKGYTKAYVNSMLATMREPGYPVPSRLLLEPSGDYLNAVASLTRNQVGEIGEAAAAAFLKTHHGLKGLVEHAANAPGLDHLLLSGASQVFIAETKATAGLNEATQRATQQDKPEDFNQLLSPGQMNKPWQSKGIARDMDGAGVEAVVAAIGCRVDLGNQTIDVWEQDTDGTWTHLGQHACDTSGLVERATR